MAVSPYQVDRTLDRAPCFNAQGGTLDELFAAVVQGFLAATIDDPSTVARERTTFIELHAPDVEQLLYAFIDELADLRDERGLLLRPGGLMVDHSGGVRLRAELRGEPLHAGRHRPTVAGPVRPHDVEIRLRISEGWEANVSLQR